MKTLRILFLVMVTIAAVGCGGGVELPETPVPELSEAYPEVAEFLVEKRDAVDKNRQSAVAWGKYGMALDAHEYAATAEKCYEVAVLLEPESARWKFLLARRLETRVPGRAIELLQSMDSGDKSQLTRLLKLADLHEQLGNRGSLAAVLKQLREQFPDQPAARYRVALAALANGDFKLAEELNRSIEGTFRESARLKVQLDARNGQSKNMRADTNSIEGLPSVMSTVADPYASALDQYRRDPLWMGKKASEEAQAGSQFALLNLEELVRKHPRLTENRVQLALNLSLRKRNQHAEQLLRQGLESQPNSVKLLASLATIQLLESDWPAAEKTLRQVIDQEPNHAAGWADLAFALEQQRKPSDAIEAYKTAVKWNPRDQELAARFKSLRGRTPETNREVEKRK